MEAAQPRSVRVKITDHILSMVVFVVILGIWQLLATQPRLNFLFGSPSAVFSEIVSGTINGVLPYHMLITGFESLIGFIVGITLGTLVGFLLWYSERIARIFKPYVIILGTIPVFAFAPIIIIWFGIGIVMKIALAAFGTFLIALAQSYEGAKSVDEEEYKLLRLYGATRAQMLQKVIFPSSLSWIFASMKLNIGFAILGAFIGEFISSDVGLGYFMIKSGSLYNIPAVFAGGFFLILLSLVFNLVVGYIEKNRVKIIELFA